MSRFKVGDEVRVKAGISSETHSNVGPSFVPSMDKFIGKKIEVDWEVEPKDKNVRCCDWNFSLDWLEPWNPAEEWDGAKWVPKKPAFARGDKVKIVGPSVTGRKEDIGKEGIVREGPYRDGDYFVSGCGFFDGSSLELAEEPYRGILATDHIVILRENGVLKTNSPPHVHPSFDDASKEAKRLAEKHKGQEFCVFGLKAVERREKSKPSIQVIVSLTGENTTAITFKRVLS